MADLDRETLFTNEAFVIGMLQAVSGGSIVAALSQAEVLIKYGGRLSFLAFITAVSLALIFALLAAYWKHQYKMWDVKSNVSEGEATYHGIKGDGNKEFEYRKEAEERQEKANKYLRGMRRVMLLAVLFILLGVGELVVSFWYQDFCKSVVPNTALNLTRGADAPLAGQLGVETVGILSGKDLFAESIGRNHVQDRSRNAVQNASEPACQAFAHIVQSVDTTAVSSR